MLRGATKTRQKTDNLSDEDFDQVATVVHFVRHGLVHNPRKVFYGRLPEFALSNEGIQQVQAAAVFFRRRPIAAIYSSPMLRAQQTAAIIQQKHQGLAVTTTELINEIYTQYEGQPIAELERIDWEFYENVKAPYESPHDIFKRLQDFLADVRVNHLNQEVVAVSHGDIICFAMTWAKGWPIDGDSKRRFARENGYPTTASITTLTFTTDSPDDIPQMTYSVPYN